MNGKCEHDTFQLTEEERAAVFTALDRGYFAVPRRASLSEIADELGTTDVEASVRIRTGVDTILKTYSCE
ncbi:helix-turn-helix domain-containing protein [Halomarina litorea]|uniref:helix-turn-helix domain-containing protein n=1 Tax=Halomarina litorea TaxID=2961595 RepID=UPI0020C4FC5C|nr:helix-turn-helix domain-containing protein [Halomarina sp. BCD28]